MQYITLRSTHKQRGVCWSRYVLEKLLYWQFRRHIFFNIATVWDIHFWILAGLFISSCWCYSGLLVPSCTFVVVVVVLLLLLFFLSVFFSWNLSAQNLQTHTIVCICLFVFGCLLNLTNIDWPRSVSRQSPRTCSVFYIFRILCQLFHHEYLGSSYHRSCIESKTAILWFCFLIKQAKGQWIAFKILFSSLSKKKKSFLSEI